MNYRVYVNKKKAFQVEAESLAKELKDNLGLTQLESVNYYNVYDIFDADDADLSLLKNKVLSETVTDEVNDEIDLSNKTYVAFECLPGQYDQRADSAEQCLMLLNNKQGVVVKSGRIVVLNGVISEKELKEIKNYLINPVEMREKDLSILSYVEDVEIEPVLTIMNFIDFTHEQIVAYRTSEGLAMSIEDLEYIRDYFKKDEQRDPTETEIKVLDTYWSDHCRHTTFETCLKNVSINAKNYQTQIQKAYDAYCQLRSDVHQNRKEMTLMDMATIGGKYLRKMGQLDDMEISDEINACSIEVPVDVNGKEETWLLMFKNETHNHPTEIEPFGGASTCIGGAIRDPLSGRSYVYQAMRITGAGDITADIKDALPNKLPQSRISKGAAHGYSSYGNQIGLATTYVKELFHDGYTAKRMEVGAVIGAAPKDWVVRKKPAAGDVILLLGGATGRDGVGGATGSSKEHNDTSLTKCSSEVQKGNAPIERKLQRLFRNPEVTKLIKKANDFGAGGVSVAVGEIADGLRIDLDKVEVKYNGLSGTELAISESQERMAVLVEAKDVEKFKELAYKENLKAYEVAQVTEEARLVMSFNGEEIVNIARSFLDTNGVRQSQEVIIEAGDETIKPFKNECSSDLKTAFLDNLKQPNTAGQKGLVEMFDSTIGKSTVLMPFGGKYQLSETEGSVQKLPVLGVTSTCSLMTFGYNPVLADYSPYLAGSYSVVEALAKLTALGGDYRKARLTCQEYFERLNQNPEKWGKPMQALLGLIEAQIAFGTPAIGGKDSMSGTFNQISVPPTLITFAVATEKVDNIISTEFKESGHKIYFVKNPINSDYTLNYDAIKANFTHVYEFIKSNKIVSASTVKFGGLAECLAKMSFGNKIGFNVNTEENVFDLNIGGMIIEAAETINMDNFIELGETTNTQMMINHVEINIDEAINAWCERYEKLYPLTVDMDKKAIDTPVFQSSEVRKSKNCVDKPKVIIPVFPGSNCEFDTKQAFERAGADVEIIVFKNMNVQAIEESLNELSAKITGAQILALGGGFSSGDEPDGSGKFIANVLSNEKISKAIDTLLANDGLIIGICNGFQALIKSGYLPYGNIASINESSPTLFRNNINRHVSKIGTTKIVSTMSPWLSSFEVNETHSIAFSHGEGKFVVSDDMAKELFARGQVATQYTDLEGQVTMNGEFNINGSSYAIEGITSADGRIFGKMGHSERYEEGLFKNISGNKRQDIFTNGVQYFKK